VVEEGLLSLTRPNDRPAPLADLDEVSRDQMTKLVQRLFLLPGSYKAVVFSAVDTGNGCSWMTVRCAELLASQTKASVCLVDANLRSPSLHTHFGMPNDRGLTDAITQGGSLRDFANQLSKPNLWLMSCGSPKRGGPELLGSDGLRSCLLQLRNGFDYVLIDAPPLSSSSDAIVLGHSVDGVALILEGSVTRRETAQRAVQELEKANVRVLGAVMNKRTFPIPEFIYNRF
jgi:capsular exopolysaccharide synthesis family protein